MDWLYIVCVAGLRRYVERENKFSGNFDICLTVPVTYRGGGGFGASDPPRIRNSEFLTISNAIENWAENV